MCTVTWTRRPDGYSVFFNRDELRSRKEALPPRVHDDGTVSYVAPEDGDFGGTWLSVNGAGVTIGLLNGPAGVALLYSLPQLSPREPCPSCGRPRVVTRPTCEHCQSSFEPPSKDGTEIFG